MKSTTMLAKGLLCLSLLLVGNACQKKLNVSYPKLAAAQSLAGSTSQIYAGFYRTYGNHYGSITAMPSSVNVVILFGGFSSRNFSDSLANIFVPALHAKGIKIEYTGSLALISGAGSNAAGYHATVAAIMDTINKYGLDGFDIDIESQITGQTLTDYTAVYDSLAHYLGPKSGTGKLLTFDTNQDGTNSLFDNVYADVSYVYLQVYGQGTSNLSYYWGTFSPYITSSQFIPGFSFYEENGYPSNVWYDVNYPINGEGTGNAYNIASWGPKGGEFGYAIDRDAPLTSSTDNTIYAPNYIVSQQLAAIMNPSGGDTGLVSGATYKIVSAVNNSSVLDVTGGSSADGTDVELWSDNSPTSTNQEWVVTSTSNGYYILQPVNAPGKVMNIDGGGTANGTQIIIWDNQGSSNEEWTITSVGSGYYNLSPASAPGSSLDDNGQGTANGNKIQIWTSNGTVAQKWQFVKQ